MGVQGLEYIKLRDGGSGYRDIVPIMENHVEKHIENEMKAGVMYSDGPYLFPGSQCPPNLGM